MILTRTMIHMLVTMVLGLTLMTIKPATAIAAPIEPGEVVRMKLKRLRPTQFNVGFRQIDIKRMMLEDLSKKARERYLERHPIPVVVGYNGDFYMIDHHHLARAVVEAGLDHVYIIVLEDWSSETKEDFWHRMEERGFVYLHDVNSRRRSVEALDEHISDLTDDPYRALAGEVRDEGGYRKTNIPFSEFKWADYFRETIDRDALDDDWHESVKLALRLARNPNAQHLPGYKGRQCSDLFH